MANLNSTITVSWERRRADITICEHQAENLGIKSGVYPVYVLGLFSTGGCETDADPYFVCELANGRCTFVGIDRLVFNPAYKPLSDNDFDLVVQEVFDRCCK